MLETDDSSLIGDIYEAAVSPNRWQAVMDGIGRCFGSHTGAVIVASDVAHQRTAIFSSADRTSSIQDYQQRWANCCAPAPQCRVVPKRQANSNQQLDILQAAASLKEGEVRADYMLMDMDALERSEFYNEHLVKFDFCHAFVAKLWEGEGGYGILSLSRARISGAFTADDLARYLALQLHIQRALAMGERLAWSRVGGADGEHDFLNLECPAILVDQSGTCRALNAAAEASLTQIGALRIIKGHVRTSDPAADAAFAAAIGRAVDDRAGPRRGGAVLLPRGDGRAPVAALLTPIGTGEDWFLRRRPSALVTLVDPEVRPAPDAERLRSLYGLTASEAAVARGIARGLELSAVASDLGLTINTARQYLTRVYTKTHTSRQHDLARLLATLSRLL